MGSWIIGVVLVIATVIGTIAATRSEDLKEQQQQGHSEAVVGSMMVYRNKVTAYAETHPTVTGAVSNSNLALPSWYTPIDGIRNFVAGGQGYVYFVGNGTDSGQAYLMLKKADNSINVGIKRAGALYNPIAGTTLVALPAAIPDDAVVFAPAALTASAVTPPGPPPAADCVVSGGTGRSWAVGGTTCAGTTAGTVSVTSGYTLTFNSSNGNTGAADYLCTNGTLASSPSTATCTVPPAPCTLPSPSTETATETRTAYQTIGCPAGYIGQRDQSRPEERTRSRTAYCPAPTGPYAWGAWGAYSAWAGTGPWTTYNDTCAAACAVPSPSTQSQTQWVAASGTCPAGQTGSITWEKEQSQQRTAYCPAPTGAYAWGGWSSWSDTGNTRNYSNTCATPCTLPSPSTETQTQWVPRSQACPAGQTGSITWEAEQSQQRTAYCPAPTGAYAWGGWSGWGDTGNTRSYSNTCVAAMSPAPSRITGGCGLKYTTTTPGYPTMTFSRTIQVTSETGWTTSWYWSGTSGKSGSGSGPNLSIWFKFTHPYTDTLTVSANSVHTATGTTSSQVWICTIERNYL